MGKSGKQLLFNLYVRVIPYFTIYAISAIFCKSYINIIFTVPTLMLILLNLLALRGRSVSTPEVILFVCYLAFVIRPLQVVDGNAFTGTSVGFNSYSNITFFLAHSCVWAFLLVCSFYFKNWRKGSKNIILLEANPNLGIVFLAISIISFSVYLVGMGGVSNVLAPRFEKASVDAPWLTFFRALQMTCTALLFVQWRQRGLIIAPYAIASLAILIISANPFNTSRFSLLAAYVPLALIWLRGKINSLTFMVIAGVFALVVMPILNVTTRGGNSIDYTSDENQNPFTLKFVDAFDMAVENVSYTDDVGYTYGSKTIGNLLFLIPRSIWRDKPTLNGLDVGGRLKQFKIAGTDNLSMPIFSDGYRDLNLLGAIVASIVFMQIIHIMAYRNITLVNGIPLANFIIFASIPITVRGPFSSTFPLLFFQIVSLYMMYAVMKKAVKRN